MAYCVSADVIDLLPDGYSLTTLPTADITEHIVRADGRISSILTAERYYPFNAHDATPPTPEEVKMASIHLALGYSLRQLALVLSGNIMERADSLVAGVDEELARLMSDSVQMEPEQVTAETLSFASAPTESWELSEGDALIASTTPLDSGDPPNILTKTVRVTTSTGVSSPTLMRDGSEFKTFFDVKRQAWIFRPLATQLWQTASVVKVNYQWDYRRRTANSSMFSGVLSRA